MPSGFVRKLFLILGIAAAYFFAAQFGLRFAFVAEQVTPVWPPAGIALAALCWFGSRVWPAVTLGAFLANLTAHEPWLTASGIAIGNTLEAVTAAWLLQHVVGFRNSLSRFQDVIGLIVLAAGISTMIAATIGVTSLCLGGLHSWSSFWSIWTTWWIGDAIGIIVVAPVLLAWSTRHHLDWSKWSVVEGCALLLAVLTVSVVVFGSRLPNLNTQHAYALFPVVIWAALRFEQRGTASAVLLISAIAIIGTVDGLGPFVRPSTHESLILLQSFMGFVAATGLLLAAAVSERSLAQRQLHESDERARFTLHAAGVGTWEWNVTTGVVQWSDNMESIHGHPRGHFGGSFESFLKDVHPDDRDRVLESIKKSLDGGGRYHIEYRQTDARGRIGWMEAKGRPIFDETGKPIRMVGVCTDVTKRKAAELALKDSERRKDDFLAILAHELRNPLAPISNAVELLRLTLPDEGPAGEVTAIISRQVQQMTRLVDDLLDLSRISRSKLELRKEHIFLETVVNSAIEISRPLIEEKLHRFSVDLPAEPILLDADLTRLAQVLANLLNNAAKFTHHDGQISLKAERQSDRVLIKVRDNGIGLPREKQDSVFEMFSQIKGSQRGSAGGLGIGLALVKSLVEMHGGEVAVHSDGLERGSEFTITLPVLESDSIATPQPAIPHDRRFQSSHRVLVVDDNRDSAMSLAKLLTLMGADVRVAFDGPEAIEVAHAFGPQVVLLDIGMPTMDGYETARRIRASIWGKTMTLVALTGWGQHSDRERSKAAGFDHHFTKPIDPDQLQEVVESLVEKSSQPASVV